jgi:hypothetical protein
MGKMLTHRDPPKPNIKTGDYLIVEDKPMLVLGYKDYARKILVLADKFGNKRYLLNNSTFIHL